MKTSTEPSVAGQALANNPTVARPKFEANVIVVMVVLVLVAVLYVAEFRRILTMSKPVPTQSLSPANELVSQ